MNNKEILIKGISQAIRKHIQDIERLAKKYGIEWPSGILKKKYTAVG